MNFSDAIDASTGTLTAGAGISHDLGAHQVISIEGSADIYASRRQYFDVYGRPVYDSGNIYQPLGTISANLGFRF